jgi:transmembrane sensor
MGRSEQQEFEAWLADDPAHRKEFEQIEALWGEMEPLRSHGMIAAELRQRTPRRRVVSVPRYAFASLLLAAIGWQFWVQAYPARTVQTAQAELKSLTLADASKIELDADTTLKLHETPFFTEVRIEHGSAFFSVTHDPSRTFTVNAGTEQVRDIGTRFGVSYNGVAVKVAVLEGEVEISNSATPTEQAQRLAAGESYQQVGASSGERTALVADQFAWHEGKLVFDDTPLGEVLKQVNRYRRDPIALNDEGLAAMRISGTFKLNDHNALLWALSHSLPLRVEKHGGHVALRPL